MAGSLSLSINASLTNGSYSRAWPENGSYTQNGQGEASGIMPTSTTKASVDVGSVTTLGFIMMKNLDGTNTIDIGLDNSGTFVAFASLAPGEVCVFRLKQGITLQLKAQAGTPACQFWLLQN